MAKTGKQNQTTVTEFDFSKSHQKLSPESFFRFTASYPNAEGTSAYLYRVSPVIDRALAGLRDSNIDIIAGGAIDEEYLLRTHGSGKYHVKFTDANRPKGLTEVAKTTVEIYDPKVPPLLNPVELVCGAVGNDRYIQGYLREGWTVNENRLTPPAPVGDGNAVLAKTIQEMASRPAAGASDALVSRALDVLSQRGGGDADIDRALAIAERLAPKADPTQVQLMQLMVSMVKGGGGHDSAPRADSLTQLKETAGFLKELGWGAAAPAAAAGGSWVDAIAALPGILQFGAEMLKQLALMRTAEAAGRVVPITGGPVYPAAAAAAVPPAAVDSQQGENSVFGKLGFGLADLRAVGDDALDAFLRGVTGAEFAGAVCSGRRNGERIYETVCAMGAEQLLQVLTMAPGVAEQIGARMPEVAAWVDAFIAAGEEPATVETPKKAA